MMPATQAENPRCRRNLSKPENQRFLHAHHIDADKSDNRPSNIKLLCIYCHAKAFNHSQLLETKDYKEYCKRFGLN
jgi:5-methylcytosine-specific restriction endonuclease McrA